MVEQKKAGDYNPTIHSGTPHSFIWGSLIQDALMEPREAQGWDSSLGAQDQLCLRTRGSSRVPREVPCGDVAVWQLSKADRERGGSAEGILLSTVRATEPMAGLTEGPGGVFRASSPSGLWLPLCPTTETFGVATGALRRPGWSRGETGKAWMMGGEVDSTPQMFVEAPVGPALSWSRCQHPPKTTLLLIHGVCLCDREVDGRGSRQSRGPCLRVRPPVCDLLPSGQSGWTPCTP